jgi:Transmembrane protein 43
MSEDFDEPGSSFVGRLWRSTAFVIIGAILGFLIVLAVGAFQYWIEDKTINIAISLEQGAASTVSIAADQVNPANNGKLVHLTGEATTTETLTDPDFGIAVQALRLTREVEVYQWKESKSESKKDGKTFVTYTYTQVWSKDKPATGFAEPGGHFNPQERPYADSKLDAKDVKLGAFALNPKQVARIPANDALPITAELLSKAPAPLKDQLAPDPEGYLFVGAQPGHTPAAPQAGDFRIRFKVAKPQTITVAAKQTQAAFEPFTPAGGEQVDLIKPGSHSVNALFEDAQAKNQLMVWVMRVLGVLVMTLGLFLVVRLWKNAARKRSRSSLYDVGLAWVSLAFAIALIAVVVGSRWVMYQAPIGGGLLGGGTVVAAGLFFVASRKRAGSDKETDTDESYVESAPGEFHFLIGRAIEIGAPVYNSGDLRGCYEIYAATARLIVKTFDGGRSAKKRLQKALDQCSQLNDADKKAWAMRHAFDAILTAGMEGANGHEKIPLERVGGKELDYADINLEKVTEEKPVEKKTAEVKERAKASPAKTTEPVKPAAGKSVGAAPAVEKKAAVASTVSVVCEGCKGRLKISTAVVGKKIRCPVCKAAFVAKPE